MILITLVEWFDDTVLAPVVEWNDKPPYHTVGSIDVEKIADN